MMRMIMGGVVTNDVNFKLSLERLGFVVFKDFLEMVSTLLEPMFHTSWLHRNSMNLSVSTSGFLCGGILVLGGNFHLVGKLP